MKPWIVAGLLLLAISGDIKQHDKIVSQDRRMRFLEETLKLKMERFDELDQLNGELQKKLNRCAAQETQAPVECPDQLQKLEDEYGNINKQLVACRADLRVCQLGPSMVCR